MAVVEQSPLLAPSVVTLLDSLRARILRYVWAQGLAATLATLCLAYWIVVGIDWLFEPPVSIRWGLLAAGVLAAAVVFYRYVVRRLAVRITRANMAVLLERRYRDFDDSLITSVTLADGNRGLGELAREMLAHTSHAAEGRATAVRLRDVFDPRPLARAVVLAIVLVGSLAAFAVASPERFWFALERITGGTNEPWPRSTRLVVPGFENGEKTIARGDDLEILVQADTSMPVVPDVVQIRYRSDDGVRGRETMTREGNAQPGRDAFQDYRHTMPSRLTSLSFDVVGGDFRVRDLRVRVVESPTISEAVLYCEYPEYMQRTPRSLPVSGTMQIPLGTRVTVRATSNKDLVRAQLEYPVDGEAFHREEMVFDDEDESADRRRFEFALPPLDGDKTLEFTLHDTDGIHNRRPFVVALSAVIDEPPQISLQLRGIGSAITPEARLPMVGQILDDYGVAAAAFQFAVDEEAPREQPLATAPAGRSEVPVDEAFEVRTLELKPGQKLTFGAQATDAYHLVEDDQPHTTTGDRYQLDIVTPDALRAMLESRELNLRQRFETIISEVTDTRDGLTRIEPAAAAAPKEPAAAPEAGAEGETAGDGAESPDAAPAPSRDPVATAMIQIERARQQGEKNAQESLGVAVAFDDIREELINNRVDTEELKIRLKDQIADPLRAVVEQMFPELDRRLQRLAEDIRDPAAGAEARRAALRQADDLLVEMERIRDKMLELESFNEAVELLRSIIESEKALQEQTRERQRRNLRGLLED